MSYKSSCKKSFRNLKGLLVKLITFFGKGITTGKWEGKIEFRF